MIILGIETSCDETSVALVRNGRDVLANDVASQVQVHARFGGVVPELASRAHLRLLVPMIDECLSAAGLALEELDAVAVTQGPGLIGALLVGVETAKALAYASRKPLVPVHHIAAHLYAPFLRGEGAPYRHIVLDSSGRPSRLPQASSHCGVGQAPSESALDYPFVGLVVSGGHTSLVHVHNPRHFELLGETVDDAAGEAFDKVAKLLNLGYPGGPRIDALAERGDPQRFALPRPMLNSGDFDFSFSGLKTAVAKLVREQGPESLREDSQLVADLCASFQEAVIEVLLRKAAGALERTGVSRLAIVGGVACNRGLRAAAARYLPPSVTVVFPPPVLCTDNAAMIAGLAWHWRDMAPACPAHVEAQATIPLPSLPFSADSMLEKESARVYKFTGGRSRLRSSGRRGHTR